ncbi:MAG: imidazolonepropionase [Chloroflexi bacterium]|nr:imidazolonepropionase [Chloroflexota bacterium]
MTALVIDSIGLLVTNDAGSGEGLLGVRRDVALVCEGDRVVAIGAAGGPAADERIDAGGRCVLPGFVDSHTHLVFAGDRADEFASRMAGRPYEAGGILTTVTATRDASDAELRAGVSARRGDALATGTTHVEVKSGYGLTLEHERRSLAAARHVTDDLTVLAAHVVPPEYASDPDGYVRLVCDEVIPALASEARWVDAFCEQGAFDADQCRAVLQAGRAAGLGLRLHANQLTSGPGVRLGVELGAASVDHCTHLRPADLDALAGSDTVATLLPASDFSTRQPYPDGRRLVDAGARVALATNCNPGSSYTTSMPFCIALAVREIGLSVDEAVYAATAGGADALRRPELGRLTPGSRADAVVLDAPSPVHLAYRPGMNLVAAVVHGGAIVERPQRSLGSR